MGGVPGAGGGGIATGRFVFSTVVVTILRPFVPGTADGLVAGACGAVRGVAGACPGVIGAAEGEGVFSSPASNALVVRV